MANLPPGRNKMKRLIIGIVLAAVLVLGAVGVFKAGYQTADQVVKISNISKAERIAAAALR